VTDLRIKRLWHIADAIFTFGNSLTDPIYEYFASGIGTHEGLGLNLEFSLKEASRI
jgi:hypothetical protein